MRVHHLHRCCIAHYAIPISIFTTEYRAVLRTLTECTESVSRTPDYSVAEKLWMAMCSSAINPIRVLRSLAANRSHEAWGLSMIQGFLQSNTVRHVYFSEVPKHFFRSDMEWRQIRSRRISRPPRRSSWLNDLHCINHHSCEWQPSSVTRSADRGDRKGQVSGLRQIRLLAHIAMLLGLQRKSVCEGYIAGAFCQISMRWDSKKKKKKHLCHCFQTWSHFSSSRCVRSHIS